VLQLRPGCECCDRDLPGDAVRSLRGPAADPRRGDRTSCGAAAPRGAAAGARAAAGAARPRRLTRARSRPPPAPPSPSVRGPGGAGSGPHLTDLRRLAGPLRRALHSAHRNDATPRRDDATPGRTPGHVAGARKGVFTAFYEVADPVKCLLLLLLLSFSSCVSMGSASRVSRGSSAFYSRSHWRARLAGA
jgi:hypothetical protein